MKNKSGVSVWIISRIVAAASVVALGGCAGTSSRNQVAGDYATPTVDYIESLDVYSAPHQDSFLNQLAMNYRSYAIYNARTSGYPDMGELFAQKAVAAFSGELPFPEALENWPIQNEQESFELYTAYNDLLNELKNDASEMQPELAAEAQAKYDCWLSAAASGQTGTANDVKFQISLAIRLTKATLPWNSFLFLTYTQKTFWNVFQNSMPMHDLNFNPAIGWSKPFFSKDRYMGKLSLLVEHESNGKDGENSRSWNRISIYGSTIIDEWLMVHAKFWIPIIDGQNNKDILKYYGIFQGGFVATTNNKRFSFGLTWMKRKGWNFNLNTIWDVTWKVSEKTNLNLFAQYYNGYGENLLDYKQFHSRFRVGIIFKPEFFSEF